MRQPIIKNIGKSVLPPSILPKADVPLTIDATIDKNLGILQDKLINIKDVRKVRRTTGQPLKPTERRGGKVSEALLKDIVGYAKQYKIDPYEAISRAIIESEGNPSYNNPFHLLYNHKTNPTISKIQDSYRSGVEAGIVALKQKEKEFESLVKKGKIAPRPPDKMEMLKLQMYNGLGRLFPDTEGAKGWMYGVKIPNEGIKMTENPLYAKELLDIMAVVKLNPSVKTIVEQAKPITKTTHYGPLKNQDYENYFTSPVFFAKGGPVYNWIPPIYPRVGARNEQGGWLDQYENGSWVTNSSIPTPTTPSFYPAGKDRTLTNYQMGTPKAPMYGPGGGVNTLEGNMIANVLMNRNRDKDFVQRAYAVGENPNSPMFNLFDPKEFGSKMSHKMAWGEDDNGQTWMYPSVMNPKDEAIKVPNQYADYISSQGYKNATGIPAYAHGATVWNKRLADKQMSAAYVVGPDTNGTQVKNTYPDRMSGAENPTNYRIGDVIMDYKSPAAGTYDYSKDIQPYHTMRLHAPDTTRMAYGGYVSKYGFGSTVGDIGKLFLNTTAAPLEQISGNNFVNFNYNNKGMADAAAVSEGILGAATDIVGTGLAGPAYGMAKGQVQGITKGIGSSQEYQRGANKWANKTGQITSSAGNLVSGIMSGDPTTILSGSSQLLSTTGNELGSKELNTVGQLGNTASNLMSTYNQFSNLASFRNGSYITSKYNPPGLRYQQLNPGVSAPAGIYTGPTTQRGITFGNGGNVPPLYVSDPNDPRLKSYNDSLNAYNLGNRMIEEYNLAVKKGKEQGTPLKVIPRNNTQYTPYPGTNILPIEVKYASPTGTSYGPDGSDSSLWTSYAKWKKPVQSVVYQPKQNNIQASTPSHPTTPYMNKIPMRGMPSINIEEAVPQKVNVPKTNPLPPQYMDTRGEWSSTPQVPPVYTPEQLLKMGYRAPQKKKNGGWLDNL